ncbi:phage baseplate assembly protein V [Endozoicomonas sp. 4G]|uniref:phage baseplate assembly protein V n=1 Tax=Endozoicomonas sp. 4G TaxID=2872754 RepID=UPI0020787693|nr:phage baseplate assembly protein V [Endozoicomonas sp. 4G]
MSDDILDLQRRLMSMIQRVTVDAVDTNLAKIRVRFMNNTTHWIPWSVGRAGGVRKWSAPQVGEDLLMLCPQGDTEQAVCLPSFYNVDFPAPSTDPHEHLTTYEDGAVINYNDETHQLDATLPEGATTNLVSTGGINLTGNLTIDGNTHSTGAITCDADVSDATGTIQANRDIFNSHNHPGDSGGTTGTPNQQQ